MITDPRFAPKRADLPWLRRRRLPRTRDDHADSGASAPNSARSSGGLGDFLAGHATHHPPAPAAPSPAPAAPAPAPSSAPPPDRPRVRVPAPVSPSLDLDEPAPAAAPPVAPAAPSTSLNLDEPAAPSARSSVRLEPEPAPRRVRVDPRLRPGERFLMSPTEPTVTLNRLQSGIGTLTIEAAASEEVGDLRLGCAYELASGLEMTMQMTQGNRFAPPHSRRPILVGGHDRFERVQLDLRQCRQLRRLIVYAFSERRQPLRWGGTLVVTTFGGERIEIPLDVLQGGTVAVLVSIYQVGGELVVRAEMETLFGDVREAARAYGYDRISWLDDRTPVE